MKIRNGFVSNSSSSSFVLIGNRAPSFQVLTDDEVAGGLVGVGESNNLCEGIDVFQIDGEMLEYIKEANLDIEIYKNASCFYDDREFKITADMVGKTVVFGTCDQHNSDSVESLMENYTREE